MASRKVPGLPRKILCEAYKLYPDLRPWKLAYPSQECSSALCNRSLLNSQLLSLANTLLLLKQENPQILSQYLHQQNLSTVSVSAAVPCTSVPSQMEPNGEGFLQTNYVQCAPNPTVPLVSENSNFQSIEGRFGSVRSTPLNSSSTFINNSITDDERESSSSLLKFEIPESLNIDDFISTLFWNDVWVPGKDRLADLVNQNQILNPQAFVRDFVTSEGSWNTHELRRSLDDEGFNGSSLCLLLVMILAMIYQTGVGTILGSYDGPQTVKQFLWLILHQRVMTNSERRRRAVFGSPLSIRGGCEETILHVIRDCPSGSYDLGLPPSPPLFDWLVTNLSHNVGLNQTAFQWRHLFGILVWLLWKQCNAFVFNGQVRSMMETIHSAWSWAQAIKETPRKQSQSDRHDYKKQQWRTPTMGSVKLNTDVAVLPTTMVAASGVVLRDINGDWIIGYHRNIGRCNIHNAELWAVLDGLTIAWDIGFRNIEVEVDNHDVVKTLNACPMLHEWTIVRHIRRLLEHQWSAKISHINREANATADSLAHIDMNGTLGLTVYHQPPRGTQASLHADVID
ncbi:hypothetical protein F3Y22_tig00110597pilonHSYRG00257 [Hibiscus syriacus]|uniref:RNase H type-1 domain-containing protein n=1 Tax=Hibiscus syriacus TaxID=106335 RepID=A0A6A3A4B5_HIBSY|nr:hypothetical protein F3Y22_tig00110597pilonHSYRG00257 [Hibiscus syriacus]